jgi:hypothetical protein
MLGQRQQQIIDLLEAGSFSFEALVRSISPDRAEDRRLIANSLRRLVRGGRIQMTNRRGLHDMAGCMVELAEPAKTQ